MIGTGAGILHFDWRAAYSYAYGWFVLGALVVGVVVKFFWAHITVRTSWSRSGVVDSAINIASSIGDFIVLPVASMLWLFVLSPALERIAHISWNHPAGIVGIAISCGFLRSVVEMAVLRRGFGITVGKWAFAALCTINCLCVFAGMAAMYFYCVSWAPTGPA